MLKNKNKTVEPADSEELFDRNTSALQSSTDPPDIASLSMSASALANLIERAKNGDNDAFSSIVEEYERFVYNTACRVLSASGLSLDPADDIAQVAFIKAWQNLGAFRGDCSFSTWLFRITVNSARDSIRSASRKPTVSLTKSEDDSEDGEEWDVPVTSGDDIPEDSLLKKEQIIAVRRAIEALPKDQKEVIVMRDIHGLSYQIIADNLGIGLGTVKSRINRGRANLKALLEKSDIL